MKKIFLMLIIVISATTIANAQSIRKQVVNKPQNVIKQLNFTIDQYGQKDKQSYSIKRNPNTNILESSEKIARFTFKKTDLNQQLDLIREAFTKDEPVSYQFKHITPGIYDVFSLNVLSENGTMSNTQLLRTDENEEMWFMCCKNPENPLLRDTYAVTWVEPEGEGMVEGYVYIISSLRPDLFEQKMESSDNIFRLDGRMGHDIHDSIYVFYMADTYEELNKITMRTNSYAELKELAKTDPAFRGKVAFLPVIDHHFEYSVNINKRKVGRQRTVMPDGTLCKLWVNLDMVPGETYRLTVHNGYFDEDRDFESRVGRYSGKSLIAGHDNDDVELTGGYNNEETLTVTDAYEAPVRNNFIERLNPAQKTILSQKAEEVRINVELMGELQKTIAGLLDQKVNQGGKVKEWKNVDRYVNQLYKQNALYDSQMQEFVSLATAYGAEEKFILSIYKESVEIIGKELNFLNVTIARFGYLSKAGEKCQKQVSKLTAKYLEEANKYMIEEYQPE